MKKKVEEVVELRKEEKRRMEEQILHKTSDIKELKEKIKNLKEECSLYKKILRETSELKAEMNSMKDQHKVKIEEITGEWEAEKARTKDLNKQMARLQMKHNKIIHNFETTLKERDREVETLTTEIGEKRGDLKLTRAKFKKHLEDT